MQSSDDELQTTLSKWPFILGDVLLVMTALAIAILGEWQLTNWQVASCVVSVALGAGLFVLPYIVEFRVRVREAVEDKSADVRILRRQSDSAEEKLGALAVRIESVEAGLTNLPQSEPDLSTPIRMIEGKIDPLASRQVEHSNLLEALAAKVGVLAKSLESKPEADAVSTLQAELLALRTELAALQAKLDELPTPVEEAPKHDGNAEEAKAVEAPSVEPIVKKSREPRQRRNPEPRLLQRAIGEKQDNSSAAVSRIIESKFKQAESAPPETPVPGEEPTAEELAPEPSSERPKTEETGFVEPEASKTENTLVDAAPVQPKKPIRMKKSDTAVIASVFIGIGNKPFVRGSGAGLSWDSGIAMEFEEIGKWRWIAPADMKESVEVQVYRNDDDPDTTGKYILAPGQQLKLSPVF